MPGAGSDHHAGGFVDPWARCRACRRPGRAIGWAVGLPGAQTAAATGTLRSHRSTQHKPAGRPAAEAVAGGGGQLLEVVQLWRERYLSMCVTQHNLIPITVNGGGTMEASRLAVLAWACLAILAAGVQSRSTEESHISIGGSRAWVSRRSRSLAGSKDHRYDTNDRGEGLHLRAQHGAGAGAAPGARASPRTWHATRLRAPPSCARPP